MTTPRLRILLTLMNFLMAALMAAIPSLLVAALWLATTQL